MERLKCSSSIIRRSIYQDQINGRRAQLLKAIDFCKENNCRGWKALATGHYPLVKSPYTINRYLDNTTLNVEHSKEYCSILSAEEEALLVKYLINKARAYQPFNRKDATKYILTMLSIRQQINKKAGGGRKFKKLSLAAKATLDKKKLSRKFWERFDTKYKDTIRKKRRGYTSLKRALSCTLPMAKSHIDELAEELVSSGIFENAVKKECGSWTGKIDGTRVFNHDETPQFINYGVDGTARNIYYCAKGSKCTGMIAENRECVTISPMISLAGEIIICHVIFASVGIKSNMAPKEAIESIRNLLISSTENGFQNGKSCLQFYKIFDQYLTDQNVKRPVVVMTDGHSSRFDLEVLRFCQEKEIIQFVSPPDTTGLLQPLDQINAKFHTSYNEATKELFIDDHINRETFMILLSKIWKDWASTETVVKSFKKCGVTATDLNVSLMQQDKFMTAELLTDTVVADEGSPVTPVTKKPWEASSPIAIRKNTATYWKKKYQIIQKQLKTVIETPISPEEVPELTKIDKFRLKKTKNFRITQIHGSLRGRDILKKREELEATFNEKIKKKQEKQELIKEKKLAFIKCKDGCTCKSTPCQANGLKQCPVCETVMKSQCNKAQCKLVSAGKPVMLTIPSGRVNRPRGRPIKMTPKRKKISTYEAIYSDSDDSLSSMSDLRLSSDDEGRCEQIGETDNTDYNGQLLQFWRSISPPVTEDKLKGKWFAAIFRVDGKQLLYIGRCVKRFLEDEGGRVTHLELDCLKPRVGNNKVLEGYPIGQSDCFSYPLEDVFGGPLDLIPIPRTRKWSVPDLDKIESFFNKITDINRAAIANM